MIPRLIVLLLALGLSATAFAQQQAGAPDPQDIQPTSAVDRYLQHLPEIDQGGGIHVTRHLAVVFGDIKDGSGIAVGPALSARFADGGFAQIKGVYSVHRFALLQARYDSRSFWRGRSVLTSRARWQDAPKVSLFPLGPDSPLERADFDERKVEASARISTRISRVVRVDAGFGAERFTTTGRLDREEDEAAHAIPPAPGLGMRVWFGHTFLSAALDSRASASSRSCTIIDAAVHDFRDWHGGSYSFERLEAGAEHLVPIGARSTVDLSARTWLSMAPADRAVPFFLMPTLGGGEGLEPYRLYRFRDRNALWLRGEFRHAVHEMVDVAGFYEAGQVSPSVQSLSLGRAARGAGAGVILHAKSAARLRMDVAHGREGFGYAILVSAGGA